MDRVAQLAERDAILARCADMAMVAERFNTWDRTRTRDVLAERAEELGFPESEISAAIDTALGGR